MEKRSAWKMFLVVVMLIVLITAIYFTFFYYKKCGDLNCYISYQSDCRKASAVNDESDIVMKYMIKGNEDGKCKVKVEVIEVKEGSLSNTALEGQSMFCYLDEGDTSLPESDLARCHGLLKEQIQEIMIQQAHAQIVKNLGEISPELERVL